MVKHELVCDANLKYQYQKGKQKFDILKRKFKTLEMDRKDIEVKLYPQVSHLRSLMSNVLV